MTVLHGRALLWVLLVRLRPRAAPTMFMLANDVVAADRREHRAHDPDAGGGGRAALPRPGADLCRPAHLGCPARGTGRSLHLVVPTEATWLVTADRRDLRRLPAGAPWS